MASITNIPLYKLYGEHDQWLTPDMVHCESIADRSKLHNWRIKLHQHHGLIQLLYLKGGSATVCLDDQYFNMVPGQIVLVPQLCIHGFKFAPNAKGHVVTLAYPLINKLGEKIGDGRVALARPHIYTVGEESDGIKESKKGSPDGGNEAGNLDEGNKEVVLNTLFNTLDAEYRGNAPYRDLLMESTLMAILIWLSRKSSRSAQQQRKELDRGQQHFRNFCQLIEEDYASQCSVGQYAKKIGITAAHLNVLCRQIVDQSALDLIHQRVVLAAKRNLVYTSMTISVVSYTLGFADPAYFTRFFKRHVGLSPKEFRKQAATLLD